MKKKNTTYRMPAGFNPYISIDRVRGLTDAIHHILLEGAGTRREMGYADKASLNGLIELLQEHVHELHAYLTEITNRTTLMLPMSDADFEALDVEFLRGKGDDGFQGVKEEPLLYIASRR